MIAIFYHYEMFNRKNIQKIISRITKVDSRVKALNKVQTSFM